MVPRTGSPTENLLVSQWSWFVQVRKAIPKGFPQLLSKKEHPVLLPGKKRTSLECVLLKQLNSYSIIAAFRKRIYLEMKVKGLNKQCMSSTAAEFRSPLYHLEWQKGRLKLQLIIPSNVSSSDSLYRISREFLLKLLIWQPKLKLLNC